MDLIVDSESGRASSTDILNRADSLTSKKLKKSETEHLLSRLVQDGWLDTVQLLSSLLDPAARSDRLLSPGLFHTRTHVGSALSI